MSKSTRTAQLHTSASQEQTAAQQRDAGLGGSYTVDPASGAVALAHRTEGGGVSRKSPLTDAAGNVVDQAQPSTPDAGAGV